MNEAETYLDLPLEDVLGDRFGRYSKYIIQERALPDARDGLKPVQRRILYAMRQDGNTADKPFRKAAKTVGNVIGNYHPHGDSSVYEALVRMSQNWKSKNMLIEMHGNNGSIDGDPPAAMRYTEARLSPIATEMLREIDKETVEFIPNFDDTQEEPVVLPSRFPNLLVNGSTGISSGYATDIPPHNLAEVIDAVIMRMDKPTCSVADIMTVLTGPDFPGGGSIQGMDGIQKAYETGKGKAVLRGTAAIEDVRSGRQQIVITEIPYDVNKATLVKKMDEIRFDKKIDGIAEVRDDTDRTGLRIVIELKKEADAQSILNYMYKNTDLQLTYNFNMVAIANKTPSLLTLPQLLDAYIAHQKEVVTARSTHDLTKAQKRLHIVEGLMHAVSVLDEVIEEIRASKDKADAKRNIQARFTFTEEQAEAIVNLQLYRLTNTDVQTLAQEKSELEQNIKKLEEVLGSEKKLAQVIKKELKAISKTYGEERRTKIQENVEELKIDMEAMIPSEDVIITISKDGYVKRTSLRSYNASNEDPPGMKESDQLLAFYEGNTTESILLFTSGGHYVYLPVYELPDIRWKDNGQHLGNLVTLEANEKLIQALYVKEFSESSYLTFFTKNGLIKRTKLSDYQPQRYSKSLVGIKLKNEDELIRVEETNGAAELLMATKKGYVVRFSEEEVNETSQRTAGVKGINLKEDEVIGAAALPLLQNDSSLLFAVTQRGSAKTMPLSEIPSTGRAKRGQVVLRALKSKPHELVYFTLISRGHESYMLQTNKEETVLVNTASMKPSDRFTNGSFVLDSKKVGEVTRVTKQINWKPNENT
ncbi:DNA topoisomerase IV subunit A [Salsuginibacillus kocurii]|uniref:DNA topoisomerase IV subunit A n=1 Tax=Salsuginibacillus kocurii TaxID=427078 RepID=UPI0003647BDC|nr:DNA topoisomerase IV subunit A [Salsuginibacillus kocurii]